MTKTFEASAKVATNRWIPFMGASDDAIRAYENGYLAALNEHAPRWVKPGKVPEGFRVLRVIDAGGNCWNMAALDVGDRFGLAVRVPEVPEVKP